MLEVNFKRSFFSQGRRFRKGIQRDVPDELKESLPRDAEVLNEYVVEEPKKGKKKGGATSPSNPKALQELGQEELPLPPNGKGKS